jgi:phosphoglucosamine mutase
MAGGRLFGTDGVRGIANVEPMTAETVLAVGRATAYVCKRRETGYRHRVLIGKDTRVSGYMLENALTAGICSMGVDVFLVGPMPTPGIAFITHNMRADAGVVLSASHNPYQDNGIKIFSREGYKLPDSMENEIEELVSTGRIQDIRPTAAEIGKATRIEDAIGRYIVFCKNTFPDDLSLEGLKIVLDCANGATYKVAPIIFSELGADVDRIHCEPNGLNINDACGSLYTADLVTRVRETGADVGLAFDGDGDRVIAVDEQGAELSGDHIIAICARHYRQRGWLKNNLVVTTVMSNFGLGAALDAMRIEREVTRVGDRFVLERMIAKDAIVGGEQSGHIIFRNHHRTGDGIIAALQLLAAMREAKQPLSQLAAVMTVAPQRLINVPVREKPPLEEVEELTAAIRAAEERLADKGRVLVRYSGTQALCRVMVEGPTAETTDLVCEELAAAVTRCLG